MDRQSVVQSLFESALRAAADPSITCVLRDWDYYKPGKSAQPLTPFLVVSMTDDTPYGVGIDLYRATYQVKICVTESPSVRNDFDRIRASVRSVMTSAVGLAAYGVHIDGVLEQSCTQPTVITESGDVVFDQTLTYRIWFEAPSVPPAVVDPEIHLASRDPETGILYTTTQASDPRRIERWSPGPGTTTLSQGYGDWADRASLNYTAPIVPLSTELPPVIQS